MRYNLRPMRFELRATQAGSRARAGTLTTLHGQIDTPVFMPVGTRGTVRTQPNANLEQLRALGAGVLLANTYHLLQRPGPDVFERFGGLHPWMGWKGSILTDSGGFQIFSLEDDRAMTEQGAAFGPVLLTPEKSIAMQRSIGSDIMMVLDQCIDARSGHAEARAAMELTHRWAARSLAAREGSPQALFAIVQGACFPDLRRASAAALTAMDGFDGYAIGGLAVGESKALREDITELTAPLLPDHKPRYLMGVGTPLDLLEAVHRGVDMFDCILPTAWAQHGRAFTPRGRIDLRRGIYRLSAEPLDASCPCEACTVYTRSYLHHLVKAGEPLGWSLLAFHNLRFYASMMKDIRGHIAAGTFRAYYDAQRQVLGLVDLDNPPRPAPPIRPVHVPARGAFAIHTSTEGFASIVHTASREIMHSVNHPDREAEQVYVAQSALLTSLDRPRDRPLVVWDVGLGAAHNAMALVRALDARPGHAPVELISFERDLDALRLALANTGPFAHLRHAGPHLLATKGAYARPGLTWTLVLGDFLEQLAAQPAPDVIFYDPFSAKVDGPMWSLAALTRVRTHLTGPTELFTYTASTAIRTSLLLAGFHVARGVPSGPKEETTIALGPGDPALAAHSLLDGAWLARRARSSKPFAADVDPARHAELEAALAAHPQFTAD